MSRAQVRPRWSRLPVYDQTLEESIGLFTFDLGIEKNCLNIDGPTALHSRRCTERALLFLEIRCH